jgi:FkbM family methyltransferase
LVSSGDSVLDIGANIGQYSRLLSSWVGPTGHVYAFEPIPQIFDFLTNNVRKLGLGNIEPLNFALSDEESATTMVIPTYRWGSECWYDAQVKTGETNPAWREIQVRSRKLDSFFEERGSAPLISFVKCDANFHELAVLRGAMRTIRNSQPAMLIEVNPDPDDAASTAFSTFELLRAAGLNPYWFDGDKLIPRKPGERSQNYFFLAPKHVTALSDRIQKAA